MDRSQQAPTEDVATLCSLAPLPDGSLRVVLDDVRKGAEPGTWLHRSLFTFQDYPPGTLEDPASLPERDLAEFGFNVLVRLLASNGHGG